MCYNFFSNSIYGSFIASNHDKQLHFNNEEVIATVVIHLQIPFSNAAAHQHLKNVGFLATTTKSFKTATACTHTLVAVGIYYTQQEVISQFPVVVSSPVVLST